jgi:hypothetical protein
MKERPASAGRHFVPRALYAHEKEKSRPLRDGSSIVVARAVFAGALGIVPSSERYARKPFAGARSQALSIIRG